MYSSFYIKTIRYKFKLKYEFLKNYQNTICKILSYRSHSTISRWEKFERSDKIFTKQNDNNVSTLRLVDACNQ